MQLIINICVTTSYILLMAVGFSLIFSTVRFFHFAHGIIFTLGAYLAFLFCVSLELPLLLAIVISIALCAVTGCLIELFIYRWLRKKKSSELIFLLASLGVYILVQNAIPMFAGDSTKILRSNHITEGLGIGNGYITTIQLISIFISISLIGILSFFVSQTKIGISIRAVANDSNLAKVSGISSEKIFMWTLGIGSALAGLAGVLVALDIDMTPTMGMNMLMLGVVAVIIGGINSIKGIILGALLLAIAQHLAVWFWGAQWQDIITFVVLFFFLLLKPEGFWGKKVSNASI